LYVQLPLSLLESLQGLPGFDRKSFETVHESGEQVTSVRFNPAKKSEIAYLLPIAIGTEIPWTNYGYYLAERPSFTFDPLFHAGCYYVQEASSMFIEQAIRQTIDLTKSLRVLDLCAAPGGKSTHIQSLISENSLLVSNEVIRSRANILKDNIIKWGCKNVCVTNNNPEDFAGFENYFDLIVVDAPCSGSGLFRRDPDAISEWSENNVALCNQRQQRILADIWPSLKKDGILIYSTCSYSKEEDEDIVDWLVNDMNAEYCPLLTDTNWNIIDTGKGYRFWPDKVMGEGFFLSVFRKKEGEDELSIRINSKPSIVNKREREIVSSWVLENGIQFIKNNETVYAWPEKHINDFSFLLKELKLIYSGVLVGDLVRDKIVPDHALAMSGIINPAIGKIELDEVNAIRYLQRKDLESENWNKGWQLASYLEHPLGWMNVLPNRINNYYPKELRILKDRPD